MKQYIENLHARPAHEKRHFSMRAAAALTALIFLIWLSTLGIRLAASLAENPTGTDNSSLIAAGAAAGSSVQSGFAQIQSAFRAMGTDSNSDAAASAQAPSATPAVVLGGTTSADTGNSSAASASDASGAYGTTDNGSTQ